MHRTVGLLLVFAALSGTLRAQDAQSDGLTPENPTVAKGVDFLRAQARSKPPVGEAALAALALIKAEVPATDPALAAYLDRVRSTFPGSSYVPEKTGGHDVYEAAVAIMALANLDPVANRAQIQAAAQFLINRQMPNGGWDYTNRTYGDASISQYAILGLWEAANAGVTVPPKVWDRAARWYLSAQQSDGGWKYHNDEPQWAVNISMTVAGIGSLLICHRQLGGGRREGPQVSSLLIPLVIEGLEGAGGYRPDTTLASMMAGAKRGLEWMSGHFAISDTPAIGQTPYYALYGVERVGALAGRETLGGNDWFKRGLGFIQGTQKSDGSWEANYGKLVNSAWSVLFLVKSTAKTLRKIEIRRMGGATFLGGRGLPADFEQMTIAHGRVVVKPMNGAVEGMLAVLEDPRAQNAENALAGLVARYQAEGPSSIRPYKDRFRKLLTEKDPGLRRVAIWALGRMGDLDAAPLLIAALRDENDDVVAEARIALQVLSRKTEGLGPPRGATAQAKAEAARRWRAWFDSVRPPSLDAPDDDPFAAAGGGQ